MFEAGVPQVNKTGHHHKPEKLFKESILYDHYILCPLNRYLILERLSGKCQAVPGLYNKGLSFNKVNSLGGSELKKIQVNSLPNKALLWYYRANII